MRHVAHDFKSYAPLVQPVEHPTFNRRVAGSNPVWGIRPFGLVVGHRTLTPAGPVRFRQGLFMDGLPSGEGGGLVIKES